MPLTFSVNCNTLQGSAYLYFHLPPHYRVQVTYTFTHQHITKFRLLTPSLTSTIQSSDLLSTIFTRTYNYTYYKYVLPLLLLSYRVATTCNRVYRRYLISVLLSIGYPVPDDACAYLGIHHL